LEFELSGFAVTFAIGGLVGLLIWFAICAWREALGVPAYIRLFTQQGWFAKTFAVVGIVSMGMLAEDLSNKYVDTDELPFRILPMMSEDEAKRFALFGRDPKLLEPSPLAVSVARVGALSKYGGTYGHFVERLILDRAEGEHWFGRCQRDTLTDQPPSDAPHPCDLDVRKLQRLTKPVYYAAKNAVYRIPEYYDELKRIQMRIDFARSIALLSTASAVMTCLVLALKAIWVMCVRYRRSSTKSARARAVQPGSKISTERSTPTILKSIKVAIPGLIVAAVLYLCGVLAYSSEEREFNVRVFGYFASLQEKCTED
jgi:hypothetical protein